MPQIFHRSTNIISRVSIFGAVFFMHLRHSSTLTKMIVASGVFWLLIMLTLTLADYLTRGWQAPLP